MLVLRTLSNVTLLASQQTLTTTEMESQPPSVKIRRGEGGVHGARHNLTVL